MTSECLLAAALWLDELEAQRDAAAGEKWAALGEEFNESGDGDGDAYLDREAELDAKVQAIRLRLLAARRLVEERAVAVAERGTWPAGGSAFARAYALAKSMATHTDPLLVELELRVLRES